MLKWIVGIIIGATAFLAMVHSGNGAKVLWDVSHGGCPDPLGCIPPEGSDFLRILEEEGISVVVSDAGVLNLDLSQYDGIVIAAGSANDTPYSEEEANVIETFVSTGGGLLILGDVCQSYFTLHLNPVAQRFGVTLNTVPAIFPEFLNPIIQHPIFEGVESIALNCASALTVEPPSISTASNSVGEVGVAVAEVEQGRVIVTGDESMFHDCCFLGQGIEFPSCCNPGDNETFARNLFCWLLKLKPVCGGCSTFDDIDATLAVVEIDNWGLRNSLKSKADNARRQYDRGNLRASSNILCAFLHEVDAQDGKHISPASAQALRDCVESMAEALGIPLPCGDLPREIKREDHLVLLSLSPNPFHLSKGSAHVRYQAPGNSEIRLAVYDISGRLVRTLVDRESPLTRHLMPSTLSWDGRNNLGMEINSGIYFLRLTQGNSSRTEKLILMK